MMAMNLQRLNVLLDGMTTPADLALLAALAPCLLVWCAGVALAEAVASRYERLEAAVIIVAGIILGLPAAIRLGASLLDCLSKEL